MKNIATSQHIIVALQSSEYFSKHVFKDLKELNRRNFVACAGRSNERKNWHTYSRAEFHWAPTSPRCIHPTSARNEISGKIEGKMTREYCMRVARAAEKYPARFYDTEKKLTWERRPSDIVLKICQGRNLSRVQLLPPDPFDSPVERVRFSGQRIFISSRT
jgi:hypothetical protein